MMSGVSARHGEPLESLDERPEAEEKFGGYDDVES
jgi:hypothetical protein